MKNGPKLIYRPERLLTNSSPFTRSRHRIEKAKQGNVGMNKTCNATMGINQDLCSKCAVCYSVCPYKAIKLDGKTERFEIDLEKCEVCGLCYSACPSNAVETVYYDYEKLARHVADLHEKCKANTLVLMCRGNSPSSREIRDILQESKVQVNDYIPIRLPCAGRVPTEFLFKVLQLGLKVISIQCEDDFCRFKEGARTNARRFVLNGAVINQLGLSADALRLIKYSRKVTYDTSKCVGCDKCVFICPYKAIEAQPFATPKISLDNCMGCGACALVCPYDAIRIKDLAFDQVLKEYTKAAKLLKAQKDLPVILAFVCQWSEFRALDEVENNAFKKNVIIMEIPCFKALDPAHVVTALRNGFDGVVAAVCSDEDCKLQEGRETTERNITVLTRTLKSLKLLNRFELFTTSPRCVGDFNNKLDAFCKRIASMPPLKVETAEVAANV